MRPLVNTVGPLTAASANSVALTQQPGAGAAFTLNGALVANGVATIAPAAQITMTFAADETGHNFTVTGTDQGGNPVTETIAGTTIGTVTSVLTYKMVKTIVSVSAAAGNITVGNAQSGAGAWLRMDDWALPSINVQCVVTGTINYTVQWTLDDPNSPTSPVLPAAVAWQNFPDLNLVAQTATSQGQYNYSPLWIRCVVSSGSGSVVMTVSQPGVNPR